jgi:hypothetical protein
MPPSPADRPARRTRRPLPSVSIIIPVRDSAGLPPMLRGLPAADEVIVVTADPDEDAAVLAACPEALLVHQTRSGVGNALACGFAAATGDVVVTLDGDGATDPGELPRYVEALLAGADVAVGSRYCEGGRDLTAGRFRRGLNLVLIWLVNVLYGTHRTDPGFGYAAFWREAIDRLGLPDPVPATPATWGDGPEIQALLTVRTAARGLAVTEVPGVAYPRMRRAARAGQATPAHWLRVLAAEFRGRAARPARHSAAALSPSAALSPAAALSPIGRTGFPTPRRSCKAQPQIAQPQIAQPPTGQPGRTAPGPDRRALPDRRVASSDRRADTTGQPAASRPTTGQPTTSRPATGQPAANRPATGQPTTSQPETGRSAVVEPIWGPPRRRPEPADLWLAQIPGPLDREIGHARPTPPPAGPTGPAIPGSRSGEIGRAAGRRRDDGRHDDGRPALGRPDLGIGGPTGGHPTGGRGVLGAAGERTAGSRDLAGRRRDEEPAAAPRREVGAKRRRIEPYRPRPDLRVINGEGTGSGGTRSGRLRAVPRETTGGIG